MWQKIHDTASSLVKKFRFSIGRERAILLICMGIALLFWLFVKLSKTYQTSRMVSLEYRLPMGMQFQDPPPSGLETTFSGTGWDLLSNYLFRRNPKVIFDLPAMMRQEIERPEIISKIEESISIDVVDLSRNYLFFLLDSTDSKTVKIELDADISFSPDFSYRDSIRLSPDSVTIYGTASLLQKISSIKTESFVLKNLEADVRKELKVVNPKPDLLRLSDDRAEVFVPVEQFTEKTFKIPILMVNTRDSIAIVPSTAEIKCVVGLNRYDELYESDFVIEADFENVYNLRQQNTVPLTLISRPVWVRSVEFFPKSVEYLIIQ